MRVVIKQPQTLREVNGMSLSQGVDKASGEPVWFVDNGWDVSETFDEGIKDELLNIESDSYFVAVCQAYL